MSVTTRYCAGLAVALFALTGAARAAPAQWQTVANQAGSSVELDKSRISRLAGGKTAAWTRLVLEQPALDFAHQTRYNAVQALNHYDCAQGTFATQRRVFTLDGRQIKTENVNGTSMVAKPDSLDAYLLDEVCKPRTVGEMQDTAARAAVAANAAQKEMRARPMHAEMVSNADTAPVRSMKVADSHAAPAPASAPEKQRFIDMPLIDKSKVEDPYKNAVPAAKPAVIAPQPMPAAAPPPPPPVPVVAKPVVRAADPAHAPELSRQQRELMLATSGPRKLAKKEPEPDFSHVHWGYAGLGAPENWSKIKPGYATCSNGKRQSPIDIRGGIKVDLEPIRFDYRPTQFRVIDNGHTVQVEVGEGSSITLTGRTYPLVQFHFHRPSEERINGKPFDMVMHFVHKDYDNSIAVVAVLMEKGSEHPIIQTLWNYMPLEVGMDVAPPNVAIDLSRLLPASREYYTYMGSLTTPPCTENVLWMVMKNPVQVSPQQIGVFSRLYPNNARPVQPPNDRLIKESR